MLLMVRNPEIAFCTGGYHGYCVKPGHTGTTASRIWAAYCVFLNLTKTCWTQGFNRWFLFLPLLCTCKHRSTMMIWDYDIYIYLSYGNINIHNINIHNIYIYIYIHVGPDMYPQSKLAFQLPINWHLVFKPRMDFQSNSDGATSVGVNLQCTLEI